eukprot:959032_1
MVKTLNISEENIQIGYVWILNNGLEMNVSHFLTKAELAKHTRNIGGFRSEITPAEYLFKLYSQKKVKEGLDQVFRAHFVIADTDFAVTWVMDQSSNSRAQLVSSSDIGLDKVGTLESGYTTRTELEPFQTVEMQRMGSLMEQMIALQKKSTHYGFNQDVGDTDDAKQETLRTEGGNATASGGDTRGHVNLDTVLVMMKKNQEELRLFKQNQEEMMKVLLSISEKK